MRLRCGCGHCCLLLLFGGKHRCLLRGHLFFVLLFPIITKRRSAVHDSTAGGVGDAATIRTITRRRGVLRGFGGRCLRNDGWFRQGIRVDTRRRGCSGGRLRHVPLHAHCVCGHHRRGFLSRGGCLDHPSRRGGGRHLLPLGDPCIKQHHRPRLWPDRWINVKAALPCGIGVVLHNAGRGRWRKGKQAAVARASCHTAPLVVLPQSLKWVRTNGVCEDGSARGLGIRDPLRGLL